MKIKMFLIIMLLISFTLIANARGGEYPGVSRELSEIAVLHEARQIYGDVRVFDVTTYYNLEGEAEVYCFTLYRKKDAPPSSEDLTRDIATAREKIASLEGTLKGAAKQIERKKIKKQINDIKKNVILNTESFVTVFAGAHQGHVPVIRMHAGLPPHLAFVEEATALAKDHSQLSQLRFRRPIYFGMLNIAFEFEDASRIRTMSEKVNERGEDDNSIVDVYRKKVTNLRSLREKVSEAKAIRSALSSEQIEKKMKRNKKLKEKWEHVRQLKDFKNMNEAIDIKHHGMGKTKSKAKIKPSYTEKILKRHSDSEK